MAKKRLQDVIPHKVTEESKQPSTSVPLRKERPSRKPIEQEEEVEVAEPAYIKKVTKNPPREKTTRKNSGSNKKFLIAFIVLLVGALAVFIASLIWSSVTVGITPKRVNLAVDNIYTAKKDALAPELKYETITTTKTASVSVAATLGPIIESKAKGSVTIYNTQTSAQRLIAGTRLESGKGLIYRLNNEITVPGATTVRGTVTAGSATTNVTADQNGDIYNMTLESLSGDFKVPGFKDTPRYTKVYGRLKSPISGGYIGRKMSVDPTVASTSLATLEKTLYENLIKEYQKLIPEGYVTFDNAFMVIYDASSTTMVDDTHASISLKATLSGVLFKETLLGQYITSKEATRFATSSYSVKGIRNLGFSIENQKEFLISKGTPLLFKLKGPIIMEGVIPSEELKKALIGRVLTESEGIFEKYSGVAKVDIVPIPFWKKTFPSTADRIIIEIK